MILFNNDQQNLFEKISQLDTNRFEVRKHLRYVNKYKTESNWGALTQSDVLDIQQNLSGSEQAHTLSHYKAPIK